MGTPDITHFVFVDFENVQEVDLSPIAGQAVQVTLLLGKNQTKIDLELVKQIQQFGSQVKLIEVGGPGRNVGFPIGIALPCSANGRRFARHSDPRSSIHLNHTA
jgi:hypothetical protein